MKNSILKESPLLTERRERLATVSCNHYYMLARIGPGDRPSCWYHDFRQYDKREFVRIIIDVNATNTEFECGLQFLIDNDKDHWTDRKIKFRKKFGISHYHEIRADYEPQ